jgi:hypothetical protein
MITEEHDGAQLEQISPSFRNNSLFEIRYVTPPTPIRAAIYDRKKVNLSVRTSNDREITPSLWSINPQFVKVMIAYFEDIWEKGNHPVCVEANRDLK